MPARDVTADDLIANWLSPSQAVEILAGVYKGTGVSARAVLLERLRGGMVQAIAGHSAFEGSRKTRDVFYKIPSEDWESVDTANNAWVSGDLVYTRREYGRSERTTVRHFNVKFEPQGVYAIIGASPANPAMAQVSPGPQAEPEEKGAPVSAAHLQAWFEFYRKVTAEADDTEDRALRSARMNFPDRSVSRESVRALRGSQRRGPKKKSDPAK
jgi:hypothetical protein